MVVATDQLAATPQELAQRIICLVSLPAYITLLVESKTRSQTAPLVVVATLQIVVKVRLAIWYMGLPEEGLKSKL